MTACEPVSPPPTKRRPALIEGGWMEADDAPGARPSVHLTAISTANVLSAMESSMEIVRVSSPAPIVFGQPGSPFAELARPQSSHDGHSSPFSPMMTATSGSQPVSPVSRHSGGVMNGLELAAQGVHEYHLDSHTSGDSSGVSLPSSFGRPTSSPPEVLPVPGAVPDEPAPGPQAATHTAATVHAEPADAANGTGAAVAGLSLNPAANGGAPQQQQQQQHRHSGSGAGPSHGRSRSSDHSAVRPSPGGGYAASPPHAYGHRQEGAGLPVNGMYDGGGYYLPPPAGGMLPPTGLTPQQQAAAAMYAHQFHMMAAAGGYLQYPLHHAQLMAQAWGGMGGFDPTGMRGSLSGSPPNAMFHYPPPLHDPHHYYGMVGPEGAPLMNGGGTPGNGGYAAPTPPRNTNIKKKNDGREERPQPNGCARHKRSTSSSSSGITSFSREPNSHSGRGRGRGRGVDEEQSEERSGSHSNSSTRSSLLDEFKASKSRRNELKLQDISGHAFEFCRDQHGSRFIQQKLEAASGEQVEAIYAEIHPHVRGLMTDVFGNYVVQKFLEHGGAPVHQQILSAMRDQVLHLSVQMYGCRVVQKALEVLDPASQAELARELRGSGTVTRCVKDQNGNHVIQKCIERIRPSDEIDFIIQDVLDNVVPFSQHPYGCRVIQRMLEHCTLAPARAQLLADIMADVPRLAQDQYGNYVVQHILEHGPAAERSQIVASLSGRVLELSQHKFASNVVEKCLQHGDAAQRAAMIAETLAGGDDAPLQAMLKDQFANYVVQKMLEVCEEGQREALLGRIRSHLGTLKKFTYGKHIVARVEKLLVAGSALQQSKSASGTPTAAAAQEQAAAAHEGTAGASAMAALDDKPSSPGTGDKPVGDECCPAAEQ